MRMGVMNWFVRKWRQWFGHYYKVGDYVYTKAELEAALKPLDGLLADRAAQAKRDYEEFMRRVMRDAVSNAEPPSKHGGEVV
jgi:hypothetical protein